MSKKGQLTVGDMVPLGITVVVLAIALALGAIILADFQADQTSGSYAHNASGFGLEGVNQLASFIPTIALVIVAAVVIGILITFLIRRLS